MKSPFTIKEIGEQESKELSELWNDWDKISPKSGEYSRHGGANFLMTCFAFPEQYDVYHRKHKIGYVRLRHGRLTADYRGEQVYNHIFEEPIGRFVDDGQRDEYLDVVGKLLVEAYKKAVKGKK